MPKADFAALDWIILGAYFVLTLGVGLALAKRGGKSVADYFVSGRSLPWWLAGTSMVATTFAADTPLAVTGIVAKNGIAGNWVWWSFLPGGLLTVFFFAGLWRRAKVVTDAEFVAIRYDGKPANVLRGFRAVYLGVIANGVVMGWVNLAMFKIVGSLLDIPVWQAMGICLVGTLCYTTASGLWGIVVTDFIQFIIGMTGTFALAFFAVDAVGGLDQMVQKIQSHTPPGSDQPYGEAVLAFIPDGETAWTIPIITFAVYLTLNWWASWYPGAEPGGGGYVAQRLFATKNERHAVLAGLWFNLAHYALRPWPWIITGLCGLALYGNTVMGTDGTPDPERNYLAIMIHTLPPGWLGLLLAAFVAAYMSTISTQLNWGASYLVNDLYTPFVNPNADSQKAMRVGRLMTVVIFVLSLIITQFMGSIEQAWKYLLGMGAGTGLVLMLRWFWWRINAWSEISSMIAALVVSTALTATRGTSKALGAQLTDGLGLPESGTFAVTLAATVLITSIVWITVTLLTPPEPDKKLEAFVRRVRPPGPGWRRVAGSGAPMDLGPRLLAWISALCLIYGLLFGIGHWLLSRPTFAAICGGVSIVGGVFLALALRHPCFSAHPDQDETSPA